MDDKDEDEDEDDVTAQSALEKSIFYQTYQDLFKTVINYDLQPGV